MSEPDAIVIRFPAANAPSDGEDTYDGEDAEIHRLEAEIALKRERVVASLGELRRRVDGATDWRHWVRAHPMAFIATALSVGFLLGYRRRDHTR